MYKFVTDDICNLMKKAGGKNIEGLMNSY